MDREAERRSKDSAGDAPAGSTAYRSSGSALPPAAAPPIVPRLVACAVAVKILVTAWNGAVFDGRTYDWSHHADRAETGGLAVDAMAYDAPTYYLTAPVYAAIGGVGNLRGEARERALLDFLRHTNLLYLGAFYVVWIYGVLPRVLASWSARAAAALLILALPGYQKLAAMSHPDNLHLLFATLVTYAWVRMPGVGTSPVPSHALPSAAPADAAPPALPANGVPFARHLRMAIVTGIAGLSRPFALAAVLVFGALNLAHLALTSHLGGAALARRVAVVAIVTAVLAGAWTACRGVSSGSWHAAYPRGYIERFDRRDFDYLSYLTTFYPRELVRIPNRQVNRLDAANFARGEYAPRNRFANSFFTTLYSETWGDHWLYFSGRRAVDRKVWAKRVLFVVALPLVPLLAWRMLRAAASIVRAAVQHGRAAVFDPHAALLLHFAAGAALFLYWQLGSALSPGKQSGIKFVYVAYLYAPAVTLCFVPPIRQRFARAWAAFLAVLFVAALPVAIYIPAWR